MGDLSNQGQRLSLLPDPKGDGNVEDKGYLQTLDTFLHSGSYSDINCTHPKYFRWKN